MRDEQAGSAELTALAAGLRELKPNAGSLSRDEILFRAGRASAPRPVFWPLATAASSLAAASFAWLLLTAQPAPVAGPPNDNLPDAPAVVFTFDPSPEVSPAPELPHAGYFQLRHDVLERGLDALPNAAGGTVDAVPEPPLTAASLLRSL